MATPTTKEIDPAVCLITEARKAMQRIGKAAARNVYDWLTVGKARRPRGGVRKSSAL